MIDGKVTETKRAYLLTLDAVEKTPSKPDSREKGLCIMRKFGIARRHSAPFVTDMKHPASI